MVQNLAPSRAASWGMLPYSIMPTGWKWNPYETQALYPHILCVLFRFLYRFRPKTNHRIWILGQVPKNEMTLSGKYHKTPRPGPAKAGPAPSPPKKLLVVMVVCYGSFDAQVSHAAPWDCPRVQGRAQPKNENSKTKWHLLKKKSKNEPLKKRNKTKHTVSVKVPI